MYSFIISAMNKSGIFEIMYIITAAIKILRIFSSNCTFCI